MLLSTTATQINLPSCHTLLVDFTLKGDLMFCTALLVIALSAAPNHDLGADLTDEIKAYLNEKIEESEIRVIKSTKVAIAETESLLVARVELLQLQIEKLADTLSKQKCLCDAQPVSALSTAKPVAAKPSAAAKPVTAAYGEPAYTAQHVWVPTGRNRGYTATTWVPATQPSQVSSPSQSAAVGVQTYCTKRGCFLVNPN